ncbi:tetratricopeptide repeat protein [Prochlorococcus sp. MIT 0916]|uniref:tetratricopeptide repeat protein n=1 Tax=Prochlorococcus sp. MIT 0916 TaxID=3082521 RepID=UPI0039B4F32D
MDGSIQDEEEKKKNSEVKTFPVPFSLGENQKNITFNKNTPSISSKEQIIDQAFKFHSEGNTLEAAKHYQRFINQGFNDYRVFSNYGTILQNLGRLQEAEFSYRKAIEIKPDFAEAHYNLGIILNDLGKLNEVEFSYRKAIEIKPDFAEAHYNLGNVLRDLGKLKDAELSTRKAIEIKPDYADVHFNLGIILNDLGQLKDAELSTRKAIEIKPDFAEAHYNLGNVLRDLGKSKEAELSYCKAIEIKPDFADAHSNLGSILSDLGKLKQAELSTRKAIEIKPDFAEAYYNLGNVLRDLCKLKEAELSYCKAIEIKPDFADAHSNLGSILSDLGKLKQAEFSYRKAIETKPDYAEAHSNLGTVLIDLGKFQEAFDSYLKAIDINPKLSNIYPLITRLLKVSDPSQFNKSKLKYIINLLLEKNDISHQELFNVFNFLYSNELINNLEKLDLNFSGIELIINNKVIINALRKIIFRDLKLEQILTKARKNICHRIAKNIKTINYPELQFIIALGEQCFLNEYIYSRTEEENVSLSIIIKRCKDIELNETNISILACYFPLYKLLDKIPSLKSFNSPNKSFAELIELQILEPLKEIDLSKKIKTLGKIGDNTSQKVKSQYEENPYPRWRYGDPFKEGKLSIAQAINNEIKPNSISKTINNNQLKILIAGCGTGNQILQTQRYKDAQITAIDLSLSSLAYAQRKINELEIYNVELIQMDILEVALLEIKFDIIECGGVLHHMKNPSQGLKVLVDVLKNNGFLKLGLYSEIARQNIISARKFISDNKLQSNKDYIRDFRDTIFSGKIPELNSLLKSRDLYTLSSCRDLCFHTQEHRFTINQLQDMLHANELKFLGFLLQQPVKSLYQEYFQEDKKQTNLQNWAKFEEQHPKTFVGMYQFWVSKISI